MGELTEMILDGTLCDCGIVVLKHGEKPPGHPQKCEDCKREEREKDAKKNKR